eukprot:SAG11_NODE_4796_length_1764_cov_1.126727_2_plen_99_part_00
MKGVSPKAAAAVGGFAVGGAKVGLKAAGKLSRLAKQKTDFDGETEKQVGKLFVPTAAAASILHFADVAQTTICEIGLGGSCCQDYERDEFSKASRSFT